jgi:chromatin segregation and condensation protein Rec8/ScpA/Scc1 (kleisin family)
VFVGSLAMLFACVREGAVNLSEIPLYPLCSAYCRHLCETKELDLDEAAVALATLAYLLERKAWGLLPTPEPEPGADPEMEAIEPTVGEFAPAIHALQEGLEERSRRFFRSSEVDGEAFAVAWDIGDVGPGDLARALERLLQIADPDPMLIEPPGLPSLAEQMAKLLLLLTDKWQDLLAIVTGRVTRLEAVWTFLALLELVRLGQCRVRLFGEEVRFSRQRAPSAGSV